MLQAQTTAVEVAEAIPVGRPLDPLALTTSLVDETGEARKLIPASTFDFNLLLSNSLINLPTRLGPSRRWQMRREKLSQEFFF